MSLQITSGKIALIIGLLRDGLPADGDDEVGDRILGYRGFAGEKLRS